jgi:hypothetical protein
VADHGEDSEEDFIREIHALRAQDLDFIGPFGGQEVGNSQFMSKNMGATHEMASLTAELAGAYIFTDMEFRWELIRRDHSAAGRESKVWSPFAKAIQNTRWRYLNGVGLEDALRLRKEERLEGVRSVLRKAWAQDASNDPFDEARAVLLAEQMTDAVREAESEWASIQSEAAKWSGGAISAAVLAAGPIVAAGQAEWLAGSAAAGAVALGLSAHATTKSFNKRYPAGFFMNLQEQS